MDNDNKVKVVLVDDSKEYCTAMEFLFELNNNIDFKIYNNATSFLKDYKSSWTGFLLMDLLMPGMDGISLLEELKKNNNKMYTIVICGHADKTTESKVKKLGANELLTKPFNVTYLLDKLTGNNNKNTAFG